VQIYLEWEKMASPFGMKEHALLNGKKNDLGWKNML
jgi:hypothetical protein